MTPGRFRTSRRGSATPRFPTAGSSGCRSRSMEREDRRAIRTQGFSARLHASVPTPCPPADRFGYTNILWMSVLRGGEGRRMGLYSRHRAGLGRGLDGVRRRGSECPGGTPGSGSRRRGRSTGRQPMTGHRGSGMDPSKRSGMDATMLSRTRYGRHAMRTAERSLESAPVRVRTRKRTTATA